MKARLAVFFIIGLFLASIALLAKGANSTIRLEVNVASNIRSYFDGQNVIIETNETAPVVITKEKIQPSEKAGYTYTIVPSL